MSATTAAPNAAVVPANEAFVTRFATFCIMIYIMIYAFESPVRYVLYLVHLDTLILLRDGLLIGPLVLILLHDFLHARIRASIVLFAVFASIGFMVSYANFGLLAVPALGVKMCLGVVFGLVAGLPLIDTSKHVNRIFIALWALTVIGVVLEKFVVKFPWVGLHALVGNVDVEISRDWQVTDELQKRVGGFTRVSISAAGLMPLLAAVAVSRIRSFFIRNAMLFITVGAVALTTQKGALLAVLLVWATLMAPLAIRLPVQVTAAILCLIVDIALPIVTNGMNMAQGNGGSYSASSFVQRITTTWPDTFHWIERMQIFPLGVGLGGIGEAQRFVSTAAFHYPDNLFLFLLSSFGVVSFFFLGVIAVAAMRGLRCQPPEIASCALSVLTFILLYGSFVSIIEDQMEALFLGAAIGTLLAPRSMTAKPATNVVSRRRAGPTPLRPSATGS
jgi:hypothetical protein